MENLYEKYKMNKICLLNKKTKDRVSSRRSSWFIFFVAVKGKWRQTRIGHR